MLGPLGRSKSRTPPSSVSTVRVQSSSTVVDGHVVRDRERQVEVRPRVAVRERERADNRSRDDARVVLREREHALVRTLAILDA